jgi:hypothetical protein
MGTKNRRAHIEVGYEKALRFYSERPTASQSHGIDWFTDYVGKLTTAGDMTGNSSQRSILCPGSLVDHRLEDFVASEAVTSGWHLQATKLRVLPGQSALWRTNFHRWRCLASQSNPTNPLTKLLQFALTVIKMFFLSTMLDWKKRQSRFVVKKLSFVCLLSGLLWNYWNDSSSNAAAISEKEREIVARRMKVLGENLGENFKSMKAQKWWSEKTPKHELRLNPLTSAFFHSFCLPFKESWTNVGCCKILYFNMSHPLLTIWFLSFCLVFMLVSCLFEAGQAKSAQLEEGS